MGHSKENIEQYREYIIELGYSFFKPKVLLTAARLDIFNIINGLGLSAYEISTRLGSDENATGVFLDAMVSLDLLIKDRNQYFNTQIGKEVFIEDKENYLGEILTLQDVMWDSWSKLGESVISGSPPNKPNMFQDDRNETRNFILAMHNTAVTNAPVLSREIDLSNCKTLIDIGGGPGDIFYVLL